jgi:hypothetical protein
MSVLAPTSSPAASPAPADGLPHRAADSDIALSLVSHTNVGKTTLARTLLREDVGEVRDAPHVTEFAEVRTMVATAAGERLLLWDTPGFGDSVRLVRRLRQSAHPVGWFLSQVWDRWRDRPFWASQQAMKNLRDEADVMLYLVSAAESPEAAGYVAPEMELLGWIGKPVIVLLNQLGPPGEPALEAAELARWRSRFASHPQVGTVLPLDAFARCWVQEATLLGAVEGVLDDERRARMGRLRAAWQQRQIDLFDAAMRILAAGVARVAGDAVALEEREGFAAKLRGVGAKLGLGKDDDSPVARAQEALARRLGEEARADTQALIRLHGLEGSAEGKILARLATHYQVRLRMDEGQAALWGGVVSGALVGLKADVLSGGLTLGGGLLAGGLLGALGSAGLARCVNLVRGTGSSWLSWNGEALDAVVEAALLRYLAVAHFGRGRGDWAEGESPPHWKEVVAAALGPYRETLAQIWRGRPAPGTDTGDEGTAHDGRGGEDRGGEARGGDSSGGARPHARAALQAALEPVVRDAARAALLRLYPEAADAWTATARSSRLPPPSATR